MKTPLHYGYVVIACCCLFMGVDVGLMMSCAGIFYAPVSAELGVPVGEFGIYMSFVFCFSALFLSTAGRLISTYGARKIVGASSLLLGLTAVAMGFFTRLWEFYMAGAFIGISFATLIYLGFPTLVNAWFRTRVGVMIGICSAASGIGGIIFNPIGGAIITVWGWRAGYWAFGAIILLIVTPLLLWLLRDKPSDKGLLPFGAEVKEGTASQTVEEGVEYHRALRMPVLYVLLVFSFILMACSTLNPYIPKYTSSCGFSEMEASWAASIAMAGVTVGKLALGWVNDRNCRVGVVLTTLLGAGGLVLMALVGDIFWVLAGGSFLFGWEYAGCTVQTTMLTSRIFGRRDYPRIYSVISIALAAGAAVASGGWGLLADATSFPTAFITGAACLLLACLLGLLAMRSAR